MSPVIPSPSPELSRRGIWRTYSIDDGLIGLRFEHIAEEAIRAALGRRGEELGGQRLRLMYSRTGFCLLETERKSNSICAVDVEVR